MTLRPTTSDADATIEYLDGDDNGLIPADTDSELTWSLIENTIIMRVKAY